MTLEEFEKEFRKGIGLEVDLNDQRFVTEVTRDNIKNFAEAIGDNNPLWRDEAYARKSRFGALTAPPTFLYNVNHGSAPALGPPGMAPALDLGLLYAGAELELFRPLKLGDEIFVRGKSTGVVRKSSPSLGPLLFTTGEARYFNQKEELLGIIRTTLCRYRLPGQQAVKYERDFRPGIPVKSPDLLILQRQRRGAEPQYWEDVEVGMEMVPPLEKGLLTSMEIVRFGVLVPSLPRRIERKEFFPGMDLSREEIQKRAGLEDASDYGPQRVCWLGQMVTDWMGDDGVFKRLSCRISHPSIVGDVNTVKGKVVARRIENGEHLVDLEVWVENQAELVTAPGRATVCLPSKNS